MSPITDPAGRPVMRPHGLPGVQALHATSISHRTASLAELERMTLAPARLAELHASYATHGIEAVALSTCNRTELYTWSERPGDHARAARLLISTAGSDAPPLERFTGISGSDAARHLFRVAVGLESLIMGESEVLGQVRGAIESAEAAGTARAFLSGLFRAALRFAGRARSETAIGTGALSLASASVRLLAGLHEDLASRTVLVLGTGATGLKAARHLRAEGVGRLLLANRTARRAEEAAAELEAEAIALEDVPRILPEIDAAIAAATVEEPLLSAADLQSARRAGGAPLVLIDVSMPRAIDPACAALEGVTLHDLSGLEEIVTRNRVEREREVPRVLALLEHEMRIFVAHAQALDARPLVAELRQRAEAIRREEIARAAADGLADGVMLERVTRRIVDRLLQAPCAALRRGDLALDGAHARTLRRVLGLDREDGDGDA